LDEGNPKTELEPVLETRSIISVHTVDKVKRPVVLVSLLTALSRLKLQSVIVFVWSLLQLKSFTCKSERMPCVRSCLSARGLVSRTKKFDVGELLNLAVSSDLQSFWAIIKSRL